MSGLLSISDGNMKLKGIPNISLRPVTDCGNCRECARSCYARKAYRAYPSTKKAWTKNGKAFRTEDYGSLYEEIAEYLERKNSRWFRIHVAGDFLSQGHVDFWMMVANDFPSVKFLAFTKMFDLEFWPRPQNLQVVYSIWPGLIDLASHGPRAYMQDGTEWRIPEDAIECPGQCDTCGMCWHLSDIGRDVFFPIH